jgi:hypothetical protein
MATVQKTRLNDLVAWEHKKAQLEEQIAGVKEEIKNNTEDERGSMKSLRSDLKVATWKIARLMEDLEESVEDHDISTTLTLDDFADTEIDIELARGEMKAKTKDKNENK